eukprot:scaffold30626_cov22-Cyclotella_meneghiniana.AAC.1
MSTSPALQLKAEAVMVRADVVRIPTWSLDSTDGQILKGVDRASQQRSPSRNHASAQRQCRSLGKMFQIGALAAFLSPPSSVLMLMSRSVCKDLDTWKWKLRSRTFQPNHAASVEYRRSLSARATNHDN